MKKRIGVRAQLFVLLCVFFLAGGAGLSAQMLYEPVLLESCGCRFDPPVGWFLQSFEDGRLATFHSPDSSAFVQMLMMPVPADSAELGAAGAVEIQQQILAQLGAELLDEAAFRYAGRDAHLADVRFSAGAAGVMRGYVLSIFDPLQPVALLAYARIDRYETYHDFLVSFLDSFSADGSGDALPGPMSQFYHPFSRNARPGNNSQSIELDMPAGPNARSAGQNILGPSLQVDMDQADASQAVIDREARVLSAYASGVPRELQELAWQRFYRMIVRDNYARLTPLAQIWQEWAREQGIELQDIPAYFLQQLQGFAFSRPGGVSDFVNPLTTLAEGRGDCDSLGILYTIVLDQLGIDSILMVSDVHAHAMAAVDVEGQGAHFPFAGRQWLVAELTADVAIGQIAANMADPATWIGINLFREY